MILAASMRCYFHHSTLCLGQASSSARQSVSQSASSTHIPTSHIPIPLPINPKGVSRSFSYRSFRIPASRKLSFPPFPYLLPSASLLRNALLIAPPLIQAFFFTCHFSAASEEGPLQPGHMPEKLNPIFSIPHISLTFQPKQQYCFACSLYATPLHSTPQNSTPHHSIPRLAFPRR